MPKKSRSKRCNSMPRTPKTNSTLEFNSYENNNKKNSNKVYKKKRKKDFDFIESADVVDINSRSPKIDTAYTPKHNTLPLQAQTPAQKRYINAIQNSCLTFGLGPAGTGKSYCAGAIAAQALQDGQVEQIILTRPAVEAGENLGFLPGSVDEKFSAYIDAFRDILNERLGAGTVNYLLRHGRIVAAPLAFMRGKTFNNNRFVILDEAQNTTPAQMKMFLTRIGDIKGPNGLSDAVDRMRGVAGVHLHRFDRDDIVRSGLVREVIDRYEA